MQIIDGLDELCEIAQKLISTIEADVETLEQRNSNEISKRRKLREALVELIKDNPE